MLRVLFLFFCGWLQIGLPVVLISARNEGWTPVYLLIAGLAAIVQYFLIKPYKNNILRIYMAFVAVCGAGIIFMTGVMANLYYFLRCLTKHLF